MRIAFIQNIWHEYLGIMSISSYLKTKGHECRVFIEGGERDLINAIRNYSPHLIGFPCLTGSHQWALYMAKELKRFLAAPNIFGGIHPTFFPEILRYPQVDMVCRGEGEEVIVDLLEKIERGQRWEGLKGLSFKRDGEMVIQEPRPLIPDLNILPTPDRDIYYRYIRLARNPAKHFMASRGCLFNCSFCYNSPEKELYRSTSNLRFRNPDEVIKEIGYVKKNYPLRTVIFDDDVFIFNRPSFYEFLERYRERINLPFICNVRADLITQDIINTLKRGGCFRVCMGVESGDEELRYKVLNKRIKDSQIMEAVRLLREAGIKLLTNNMLGLPGETLEDAIKTVELNIRLKVDYPWCSILQPYPGTEIAEYILKNGYLDKIDPDSFRPTFFESSILRQRDIKEIINLQKLFYLAVKVPSLLPLIKRLVRVKPFLTFYNLIFLITFTFRYMSANRYNFFDMFFMAKDSLHLYLKRKAV